MSRKVWLPLMTIGAIVLNAAEALSSSAPSPGSVLTRGISVELGRQDFRNYCAACHGVNGNGDGTIAEYLTINAPDLTKLTKFNAGIYPREKIEHVIDGRIDVKIHGSRDMPVWGDWFNSEAISADTDRETRELIVHERIESLINYIETLQEN